MRSWEALNRPGDFSSSHSIIVVALSLPAASPLEQGQDFFLPRRRQRDRAECATGAPVLVSEGNGPHCHFRADRSLIPAMAAAVCCLFPSICLCLSNATC